MTDTVTTKSGKKTEYFSHQFELSHSQINKIIEAVKSKEPTILRLKKESFLKGENTLPLTKKDAENVIKNKGFDYTLNKAKIKMFKLKDEKREVYFHY